MNSSVGNIADTARWVAYFRARENERPDALFRDPHAERLAGERGFHIASTLPEGNKHEWAWVARTYLFDQFLMQEVRQGTDLVVNLAAGLDARPYRMELPQRLQWIEIDLPEVLSYKAEILAGEKPRCELERIPLDVLNGDSRRRIFESLSHQGEKITVMSEGLLIYFAPEQVSSLADDLSALPTFQRWIIDLASPGQLRLMQRTMGKELSSSGAAFEFGPAEGANFFAPHGWVTKETQGMLATAAKLNRLPAELHSLLPEPQGLPGNFPWTGVCLLEKHRRSGIA